jgi:hypothetical protein
VFGPMDTGPLIVRVFPFPMRILLLAVLLTRTSRFEAVTLAFVRSRVLAIVLNGTVADAP